MQLEVTTPEKARLSAETCLVVPRFENEDGPFGPILRQEDADTLHALAERGVALLKAGTAFVMPAQGGSYGSVCVLGLGDREAFTSETLRRCAGKAQASFASHGATHVVFDASVEEGLPTEAFLEGVVLGQYTFDLFQQPKDPPSAQVASITIAAPQGVHGEIESVCRLALAVCANANWARDLANSPPNELSPSVLARKAEEMAQETECACTVFGEDAMAEKGMNALLSVSKGSAEEAKLIVLEYTHPEATSTLAIVGKGITFDTGGISIKPAEAMHEMKFDMCGAAAVLGAMKTVCQLRPKVNVICVVPSSENMTGSAATRPGDIVKAFNGKTIEIHNTDAEGRLVLADALAYTAATHKPDALVDLATLTGAAVVALGHYAAALMSDDDELAAGLEMAAQDCGERVWPLPLWEDYDELIAGTHADLCNIGPRGEAGSITAACFLKHFTGGVPWAHLDIAGTAWGGKNISYLDPKHATGYGVRLLSRWIFNAFPPTVD